MYGGLEKFQTDPHWRDLILFHEYFHGDNGAGLGASHQTGWTGLVARMIQMFGQLDSQTMLHGPPRPTCIRFDTATEPAAPPEPAVPSTATA